jgi:hypothetical protein
VGTELALGPSGQQKLVGLAELRLLEPSGLWRPIGSSYLRWGEANGLARATPLRLSSLGGNPVNDTVLTNVTRLASPALVSGVAETLVLFSMSDPQKPWYAATDIGAVGQAGGGAWTAERITDDLAAEFGPRVVNVDSNTVLAAWTRVAGDVSGSTNPVQVAPHLEIVAAWFDRTTGTWSAPAQLTTNAVVDRDPVPVVFGKTSGILWIQNEADASIGDAAHGDRLMFTAWSGTDWESQRTLWFGPKGILQFAFVADSAGQGHVIFAVDEDGNLDTRLDRELYALSTANGLWQSAMRLTSDGVEDALPTLVAPNGVPVCVWSAGGTVSYTALNPWSPKPVFREQTPASEAQTLDGVTLPSGAVVAYAVQMPEGVDIFASFYDANLDRWSLPRQLTHDEDVESALSLASDGSDLVMAYLKTQTLRTNVDVVINGQTNHLTNVPQPGRTDLCVLRHALGNDLAGDAASLIVDPPNPAPGSNATVKVTIENRGDLAVQAVQVAFYDGNPQSGGTPIGTTQTLAGSVIGGAKQDVTVSWTVPMGTNTHELFVVVDPLLAIDDRDRSNNVVSKRTVLPDLAIETCWSTEVSSTKVLLVARVLNGGVIPTGPFAVSWRLGAADGQEIGQTTVASLAPRQTNEVAYLWDTSLRQWPSGFATVYAVADGAGVVEELDKHNNAHPQTVPVVPSWVPRLVEIKTVGAGKLRLTFEATTFEVSAFVVESTESLASPAQWVAEAGGVTASSMPGRFEIELPVSGGARFYRVRATP